jgi:hypothetical protein
LLAGAVVSTLVLTPASACSAAPDDVRQLAGWQTIALPSGMAASTLLPTATSLLVGGFVPSGDHRAPALARLPLDGTEEVPSTVRLVPASPYGKVADLQSLSGTDDSLVALGGAHGGAHGNARWTIWTGSVAGVTDRPQTFETFGGWAAGTLLGLATDAEGPMVLGTWQGTHGPDGAVWRANGDHWTRQPTEPSFISTAERQVGPRTVEQGPGRTVLVSGSVIDLHDGVRQAATYWRDAGGSWLRATLTDAGDRSEAWSTACQEVCWSAGSRDGIVAVWSDGVRQPTPPFSVDDRDTGRVLLTGRHTVIAFSSGGAGRLLVGAQGRWRGYTAPDGRVLAAALIGTRLFCIRSVGDGGGQLWVRDLADLLRG